MRLTRFLRRTGSHFAGKRFSEFNVTRTTRLARHREFTLMTGPRVRDRTQAVAPIHWSAAAQNVGKSGRSGPSAGAAEYLLGWRAACS
jgi:hypothetical protein